MFESLKGETALHWSGGADSTLLLAILIEEQKRFDIVQMRDFWTREDRKKVDAVIRKWNLKLFSYPPASTTLIGDGEQISVVRSYADGTTLVSDVVEGTRCLADLQTQKMFEIPMKWDNIIVGSRQDDRHYSIEGPPVTQGQWIQGGITYWAPLYDWPRERVEKELTKRGWDIPEVTGDVSFCSKCLKGTGTIWCPAAGADMESISWDPKTNLAAFRAAYAK